MTIPGRSDSDVFFRSDGDVIEPWGTRLAIITEESSIGKEADYASSTPFTVDIYGNTVDSLAKAPKYEGVTVGADTATDVYYNGELVVAYKVADDEYEIDKLRGSSLAGIFPDGQVAVRPIGQYETLDALKYDDSSSFWFWDGAVEWNDWTKESVGFLGTIYGIVVFGFLPRSDSFPFYHGGAADLITVEVSVGSALEVSPDAEHPTLAPIKFHDRLWKPSSASIDLKWYWADATNPSGVTGKFIDQSWTGDSGDFPDPPAEEPKNQWQLTSTHVTPPDIPDEASGWDAKLTTQAYAISQYTIQEEALSSSSGGNAPPRGIASYMVPSVWWGVLEADGVDKSWRYDPTGALGDNHGWGPEEPAIEQVLDTVFASSGWEPSDKTSASSNGDGSVEFAS